MTPENHKHQRMPNTLAKVFMVGAVLVVWIVLLISPVGSVVAGVTIFGLIGVLFVLGCINVRGDDFRN